MERMGISGQIHTVFQLFIYSFACCYISTYSHSPTERSAPANNGHGWPWLWRESARHPAHPVDDRLAPLSLSHTHTHTSVFSLSLTYSHLLSDTNQLTMMMAARLLVLLWRGGITHTYLLSLSLSLSLSPTQTLTLSHTLCLSHTHTFWFCQSSTHSHSHKHTHTHTHTHSHTI